MNPGADAVRFDYLIDLVHLALCYMNPGTDTGGHQGQSDCRPPPAACHGQQAF